MTAPTLISTLLEDARAVVRSEAASISALADRLDESVALAIELIHRNIGPEGSGFLAISGVGKSGLVGLRLAASFASTGTPSHFLHPVEAVHGDVGRVRRQDVALLLSYSGESDELSRLIDVLKRLRVPVISITSQRGSTLGRVSDICIELGPIEEVCPLRLAPTTTTNCISAVGDALVLGVMSLRKFTAEDFALFHPAGSLGRKLLKVAQAMTFRVGENIEPIRDDVSVREAISRDTSPEKRRAGALLLVDAQGRLSGVFTNGDLRRKVKVYANLLDMPIRDVMTRNPKRIGSEALASEALAIMNQSKILDLPVVGVDDHPVGMIDVQDLVALRIAE